mmetsp:Transcript_101771/g.186100  ORF Transcript_101771/g.186100 Transcript_101771/m.186100 type:complete len:472 (-) Transcript_101771:52-1467(-)
MENGATQVIGDGGLQIDVSSAGLATPPQGSYFVQSASQGQGVPVAVPVGSFPSRTWSPATSRVMTPHEELRLRMQGEKERKIKEAAEKRERERQVRRVEMERIRNARYAGWHEEHEQRQRQNEDKQKRRAMEVEQKSEQLRLKKLGAETEAWSEGPPPPMSGTMSPVSPRSPRSPRTSLSRSQEAWSYMKGRNEDHRSVETKLLETGKKEMKIREAKEARERARQARLIEEEKLRIEAQQQFEVLQVEKMRKKQKELDKREKEKERREAVREKKLVQRQAKKDEEERQTTLEWRLRQQELYNRQVRAEQIRIQKLQEKGDRENNLKREKDIRMAEKKFHDSQTARARMMQEEREAYIKETKARQKEIEKMRRELDIECRRARAEEARLEREEAKRREDTRGTFEELPAPFTPNSFSAAGSPESVSLAASLGTLHAVLSARNLRLEDGMGADNGMGWASARSMNGSVSARSL